MTNREQYLQERNNSQVDIEKAWKLYSDSDIKNKVDKNTFNQAIQMFVGRSDMNKYWRHYDNEHSVMKLIDNHGNIGYL